MALTHQPTYRHQPSARLALSSAIHSFVLLGLAATLTLAPGAASADEPPTNPYLAASSWPIYHANNYATAAVLGPVVAAPVRFETVRNLTHQRLRHGHVSPWTVLGQPRPDGSQAILTTPRDGVAKYAIKQGRLQPVDFLRLDRQAGQFDWGILLLADGSAVVTEQRHNQFVVVGDSEPDSLLQVRRRLPIDADRHGRLTSHFSLAYDGTLLALTDRSVLLAVDPAAGSVIATLPLPEAAGLTTHNSFPVDESGRTYLVGQQAMVAVDWDGMTLQPAWMAPYSMRGQGRAQVREGRRHWLDVLAVVRGQAGSGSGTTPTLIGSPTSGVVVVVDGHSPRNNLVAFWRAEIPTDWSALPDPTKPNSTLDRRVASLISLPYSTAEGDGHAAENSPAALGNAIVIAQWAGFAPGPDPPRGVQRVDWDPADQRLRLVWANPEVHLNGVPTIGQGAHAPCVFGMGREAGDYVYSALDLRSGERIHRLELGQSDDVLDQGVNHVITADGSIVYAGKRQLVRLSGP